MDNKQQCCGSECEKIRVRIRHFLKISGPDPKFYNCFKIFYESFKPKFMIDKLKSSQMKLPQFIRTFWHSFTVDAVLWWAYFFPIIFDMNLCLVICGNCKVQLAKARVYDNWIDIPIFRLLQICLKSVSMVRLKFPAEVWKLTSKDFTLKTNYIWL